MKEIVSSFKDNYMRSNFNKSYDCEDAINPNKENHLNLESKDSVKTIEAKEPKENCLEENTVIKK